MRVPPLPTPELPGGTPDKVWISDQALAASDAVTLFVERARAVRPDFALTPANGTTVARICRRLDGIPLALELAAVRLRAMSVEQVLERLDDRFRLLAHGNRAAASRQQTLQALIDWSYDLCTAPEQALWQRASVFSGGFELAAAEQVCAGEGIMAEDVLDLVDALVDKSILSVERHSDPRYRMLESIRSTAAAGSPRPGSRPHCGAGTATTSSKSPRRPTATGSASTRSRGRPGCGARTPTCARRWSSA
ncbi:hypothetical protein GCM10022255_091660 [Dactylosporangium darangshiense]|uniref:Uncharacterized protein n=2 Tax=Dactylosporangium darangshiense TaxID=579108 RepID=A0ABP8DPC4_9ACTN